MAPPAAIKPVYALAGSDAFLQLEKLRNILALCPGAQRIDLDGEKAELAEVLDELRSFAMFGGRRLVVLSSAEAFLTRYRSQLEDYVAQPAADATLVLRLASLPGTQRIAKAIAKVGVIEDCNPPKDIAGWIVSRARSAHQLIVPPDAARLLADMIGDDLGKLDNELAKLALSAPAGANGLARVQSADVGSSVAFQRERQMSDLTAALAAGNPAEALRKWRQMVQTDSSAEFRAVTWLTIWITNVRKALSMKKQGMAPGSIAATLRIWPRDLQGPFMETAAALGETGAAAAVDLLTEIDRQSKSGVGDAATNVERFILDLATTLPAR